MSFQSPVRRALLAGAAAIVLSGGASAQDWSGFYIGANAGGGIMSSKGATSDYYGSPGDQSTWSGVVGGTAGLNWMAGSNVVIGIEGDFDWSGASDNTGFIYGGTYYRNKARWDWVSTIRGRAGITMDDAFLYGTAGIAIVGTSYKFCYYYTDCAPGGSDENASSTRAQVGLTGGLGVEFAIDPDVSVDLSYLYIDLASTTTHDGDGDVKKFGSSESVARVGVNWHV